MSIFTFPAKVWGGFASDLDCCFGFSDAIGVLLSINFVSMVGDFVGWNYWRHRILSSR
jgi:hypothetical protein